ncbi:cryptochrome/photolyase family protein [Flagellimonas myxillae]|uniref:cryptochrome/photolyase family protein n=1 Tax=Flagellimonas myxillae TaxID=2942214 RepID=UPI00201EC84B|nr:deoxyribodipyrimidine photo-lyase [Muricauda myxillae]MCL6266173.1 DNA photolyase family protein [Muricauda myxillae]
MSESISIFWFRRDLRLEDNTGLYHALESGLPVLPIFIFDTEILDNLPKADARVTFIHDQLHRLNLSLKSKFGSGIAVYHGQPKTVFEGLLKTYAVNQVFANHDYEPYARKRDQEISFVLKRHGTDFKTFKDQVIFEKDEIRNGGGLPYKVYTPYKKQWIKQFKPSVHLKGNGTENHSNFYKSEQLPFLSLEAIGFERSKIRVKDYDLNAELINNYEETRNIPALDKGTSRLGPHLRFGTISIREAVQKAIKSQNKTFLSELIWREFFMQILWHFPHTVTKAFKPKYDNILWRNDQAEFNLWKTGRTGYVLVDAGMRQLNVTGYMHNRVRMVVASFLCKHLLIDWRWGEAYFALKLLDYELASNVGNWQWAAGSGVDAAPYFRIFNPTHQLAKFDAQGKYINKWVPEFQELSYPPEMVNHQMARERCLKVYKAVVG